jgi:periplasmic protein TonB
VRTRLKFLPPRSDRNYAGDLSIQENDVRLTALIFVATVTAVCGLAQDTGKKLSKPEALAAVVSRVQPDYPPMAQQLRIQGEVELEAMVGESGAVEKVTIVSGNPVLSRPASDALKKWRFRPLLEDGKPSKFVAPVQISFRREAKQ